MDGGFIHIMGLLPQDNSTPEPDGSIKKYFIRVNPECKTAHEAVARGYRLSVEEYDPEEES